MKNKNIKIKLQSFSFLLKFYKFMLNFNVVTVSLPKECVSLGFQILRLVVIVTGTVLVALG